MTGNVPEMPKDCSKLGSLMPSEYPARSRVPLKVSLPRNSRYDPETRGETLLPKLSLLTYPRPARHREPLPGDGFLAEEIVIAAQTVGHADVGELRRAVVAGDVSVFVFEVVANCGLRPGARRPDSLIGEAGDVVFGQVGEGGVEGAVEIIDRIIVEARRGGIRNPKTDAATIPVRSP